MIDLDDMDDLAAAGDDARKRKREDAMFPVSDNTHADGSPKVEWKRLIDMPTDVLSGRVVGSFILAKGNLVEYQAIVKNLLDAMAKEHAESVQPEGAPIIPTKLTDPTPYAMGWNACVDSMHEWGKK